MVEQLAGCAMMDFEVLFALFQAESAASRAKEHNI
jgi:hypothetical protein